MERRYKAILFDLDNTLLDYQSSIVSAMRRTCGDHGLFRDGRRERSIDGGRVEVLFQ
jgi:phosphoglycolate phosphatase-like HAD superfamily hydrolase